MYLCVYVYAYMYMRKPIAEWWRAAAAVCRRARLRDRQERARPAGNPYIRLSIPPVVR